MAGTLVPSFTFGPTGFVAPSSSDVLTGVQGDISAAFGSNLNYQLTTPQGQLASSEAAVINNCYSLFQYYTQQVDPAYATGRMQDAIGRLYGLTRNPAQPTALQVTCTGAVGVVIPQNSLIQDSAGNLYQSTLQGTIGSSGSVTIQFNCTVPGPVSVPSSNAVSIYQAIPGWDSVAVLSGTQGVNVEGRAAFETRRLDSVAGNSLGPIGAIIGQLALVPGVLDYWGYNNNTQNQVTVGGITIPAYSIAITVAAGTATQQEVANAIFTKKGAGAPMTGNTTVTVYDSNPLYAEPIAYTVTYYTPQTIQILWNVSIVNNPGIPSDAATQLQNALIAAATGQSTLTPAPPKIRIGTTVFAAQYLASIQALGSWAQIRSLEVGSINTNPTVFNGSISGNTLTVDSVTSGTVAIGQFIFDSDNRITNGTQITAGSGTSWTVNNPQTVGAAAFTGNTSGSSTSVTASSVTGTIGIGDVVVGTGIPAGTTVVSQTSGTTGGAGVYVLSAAVNLANVSCTTQAVITAAIAASSSTVVNADQFPEITAPNIVVTAS